MDFGEILPYIATSIGSIGATLFANWGVNKLKTASEVKVNEAEASNTEAEARSKEIENMRKAMEDFYTPLVNRQNARIAELEEEVKQLRNEKRAEAEAHAKQLALLQEQIVEINRALGIRAKSIIKEGGTTFYERKSTKK